MTTTRCGNAPGADRADEGGEVAERPVGRRVGDPGDAPGGESRAEAGQVGRRGLGEPGPAAGRRPGGRARSAGPLPSRSTSASASLVEPGRREPRAVQRPAGAAAVLHPDRAAAARAGRARSRSRSPATDSWYPVARIHCAGREPPVGARAARRRSRPRSAHVGGPTRTDAASAAVASRWMWWSCRPGSSGAAAGVEHRRSASARRPGPTSTISAVADPHVDAGRPTPSTSAPADEEARRSRRRARPSTAAGVLAERRAAAGRPGAARGGAAATPGGHRQRRAGRPGGDRRPSRRRSATGRPPRSASSAARPRRPGRPAGRPPRRRRSTARARPTPRARRRPRRRRRRPTQSRTRLGPAVAGDRHPHLRPAGADQLLGVDAQLLERPGPGRLDHHVGGRRSSAASDARRPRRREVERDRAPCRRSGGRRTRAGPSRAPSGRRVDSTLTTSAPAAARSDPQSGPAHSELRSTTRGAVDRPCRRGPVPATRRRRRPVGPRDRSRSSAEHRGRQTEQPGPFDEAQRPDRAAADAATASHGSSTGCPSSSAGTSVDVLRPGQRQRDPAVGGEGSSRVAPPQLTSPAAREPGDRRPLAEQRERRRGRPRAAAKRRQRRRSTSPAGRPERRPVAATGERHRARRRPACAPRRCRSSATARQ